jgi:hypothetical protein
MMGRLGVIAGTFAGVARALKAGGVSGDTVPRSYLLGDPTNLLVTLLPHFDVSSGGSGAEWSVYHLSWCAAIAVNWTLVGVAMDLMAPASAASRFRRACQTDACLPTCPVLR